MINITELLDKCLNENRRKRSEMVLQCVVRTMIPHIGKSVLFKVDVVTLSWEHISSYLQSPDLYMQLLTVFEQLGSVRKLVADNRVRFQFPDDQTAIAFFNFTFAVLPMRNAEYPQVNNTEFIMTDEQYYCCQFYSMQSSGKVVPEMLADQYFLKTLRADTLDYSYAFMLGIMPNNGVSKRQNLRYVNRGNYTVNPKGQATSRINKQPMYSAEQKKGFSQIQSCTFIDRQLISPPFGFAKERNRKLYGLMTHSHDVRINRMLVNDAGTIGHVFDSHNSAEVTFNYFSKESSKKKVSKKNWCYSVDEFTKFKSHNLKERPGNHKTNECLGRIRFNIYRSVVSICSDTLESRLLAYDFAEELLEYYSEYAKKNGFDFNKNFRIPIIFYIRKKLTGFLSRFFDEDITVGSVEHELKFYTEKMLLEDRKKASEIYNDRALKRAHFQANNYEFLLGLPIITAAMLLEEDDNGLPLVFAMIKKGYVRMVMRLLRKSKDRENIVDEICHVLIKRGRLLRNDPIISQFIIVEAFDIADKLLRETNSNKNYLCHGEKSLYLHLVQFGNPRQLHYMGFDMILIDAAANGAWVTIVLCIKEFPDIDKWLLGRLLCYASRSGKYKEAELLLKMGAHRDQEVSGLRAIQHAVQQNDWAMVGIFTRFDADPGDDSFYGFALFKALQHQQPGIAKLLLLAGAKPNWRRFIQNYGLESTVYYAVEHGYTELLPDLINHESQYQYQGQNITVSRNWLAGDLAAVKKNEEAQQLLSGAFTAHNTLFKDRPDLVCRLVVEALAVGNLEIVKYRLRTHLSSINSDCSNNFIIMQGFHIIKDYLHYSCSFLTLHYKKIVLSNIIEIFIENNNKLLLIELVIYFRAQIGYREYIDNIFFRVILKKISDQNINFIQDLIKETVLTREQNASWQSVVDSVAHESVNQKAVDMTSLLLRFGANPESSSSYGTTTLVERIAQSGNESLLKRLMTRNNFTISTRVELLSIAIRNPNLKWLAIELIDKYKTRVNQHHIALSGSRSREDILIRLLDAVDKTFYHHHSYEFAFFSAWVYGFGQENKEVCKRLMVMLGSTYIRHLTILYLLVSYRLSLVDWGFASHLFNNLDAVMSTNYRTMDYLFEYKITLNSVDESILGILNSYFAGSFSSENDGCILSIYKIILEHFELAFNNDDFSEKFDFYGTMHAYLNEVEVFIQRFRSISESETHLAFNK